MSSLCFMEPGRTSLETNTAFKKCFPSHVMNIKILWKVPNSTFSMKIHFQKPPKKESFCKNSPMLLWAVWGLAPYFPNSLCFKLPNSHETDPLEMLETKWLISELLCILLSPGLQWRPEEERKSCGWTFSSMEVNGQSSSMGQDFFLYF